MTRPTLLVLTLGALAALPAAAMAQYVPVNPYYPGWGGYGYGRGYNTGAALQGAASVLSASGQLNIQNQQAYQQRAIAKQEMLKTKKMAFDEANYEKANTPTYTEELEKNEAMRLRRLMLDPAPAEITRGDTLNTLLPVVASAAARGVPGPPLTLSPDLLKSINVTATAGGGTSMLKDVGRLKWPIALRGPTQKKLDAALTEAVKKTVTGELDAPTYNQVTAGVKKLQGELFGLFKKDQVDTRGYLDGKRFLERLTQSVQALQDADAAKYLDGSFSARGSNVPELAQNMVSQGQKFAPAVPGQEAAYNALNGLFVAYVRSSQASTGFQANATPPLSKAGGR